MPLTPRSPAADRMPAVIAALDRLYPDARCGLTFADPLQLLVATILSAQCTDKMVNTVTPALFAKYKTAAAFAAARLPDLERLVKRTGFYRTKAKNIRDSCRAIIERHGGQVPADLDTLVTLPGVGRKTANVVLGDAFGVPGITVDTHVGRLSRRIGLTAHTDPVKVERDLMPLIPQQARTDVSHRLILHGRTVCFARKPDCPGCGIRPLCPRIGVSEEGTRRTRITPQIDTDQNPRSVRKKRSPG